MFIKIFLATILFPFFLHASTFNIESIQKNFYNKVVLEPLYIKRYKKPLDTNCKSYNEKCYNTELTKLLEDANIQKSLKKRDRKFNLDEKYWYQVKEQLWKKYEFFSYSQFISFVDLSKQVFILILWDSKTMMFYPMGFDFISSGNINREKKVTTGEDHYLKTPVGLFSIQSGWRSNGKIHADNITMPYGEKDRFIFYFGTQTSIRYNTFDKNGTKITDPKKWKLITDQLEFALHAHISTAPLGEPNSHGCIRMSNELNLFLDNNLVFFRHLYNENKEWTHPYKKPPTEPKHHGLAGKFILIVDDV